MLSQQQLPATEGEAPAEGVPTGVRLGDGLAAGGDHCMHHLGEAVMAVVEEQSFRMAGVVFFYHDKLNELVANVRKTPVVWNYTARG